MALYNFQIMPLLILTLLCSVPTLYLLYSAFRALSSPLRGIPGPFLARFTRFWKLKEIYKGSFEKVNVKLHQKYGKFEQIQDTKYDMKSECRLNYRKNAALLLMQLRDW